MKARVLLSHRARRIFFFIHLWTGLILGAWFALIGITGSVLAWRGELSGMELSRRFPIEKSVGAKVIPLSAAIAAMKRANPDASAKELATVTVPNSKNPFYSFSRGRNRATAQTILVDPYSARVHPPVRMRTLTVGTIQQFHQRLISGAKGYVLNGFLNFLAIPLLLSGLWLWWPTRWKHLKAHLTIKRGASLKRTIYDLHNVMGIYLYVVLLATTVTGAMLVQQHISADGGLLTFLNEEQQESPPRGGPERSGGRERGNQERGGRESGRSERTRPETAGGREMQGAPAAGRREPEAPKVTPAGQPLAHDELVVRARSARPQYQLTRVQLPQKPDEALQLTYAKPTGLNLNETVFLNPYTGEELSGSGEGATPNRSPLRTWTRTLHLGEFGGVFSKLIYTITGLMPLGLFVTGFMLWWRKKRVKMKKAAMNP